jgi:hypothetical protein
MSQHWGMSKTPTTAVKFRVVGKIRTFCFLPSLIETSRAAWCGAPLEMTEGTTFGARVQSAFKAGSAEWVPQQRPLPLTLTYLLTCPRILRLYSIVILIKKCKPYLVILRHFELYIKALLIFKRDIPVVLIC